MRYDDVNEMLKVTTPVFYRKKTLESFLKECHPWIIKQLIRSQDNYVIDLSKPFSVFDHTYKIELNPMKKKGLWENDTILEIGGKNPDIEVYLQKWIKQKACSYFSEKSNGYAEMINKKFTKISIRDSKTRWGSCSSTGTLSYSWRVAFAPEEVADYLCVHEVCHLQEMNHSPKFWNLVESLCCKYKTHKKWLRNNGKLLQKLQFNFNHLD
jgi:predicted metal-dependent hydrolase